jgi:succinoglycan biosynthesis protein ExoU
MHSANVSTAIEVAIIIAAKDAAATIGEAVVSALAETETREVIVVDDGSSDGTSPAAWAADDGSGRLSVIRLDANRGPSHARNLAIERSTSPFIAILDADDRILKGRFRTFDATARWDIAADNILFVDERAALSLADIAMPAARSAPRLLSLDDFIDGNISRRGMNRGEFGFLKPVIRRSFLDAHGLRYSRHLRLGEDYDLYARALICGAVFELLPSCGYLARVRANSLSGRHRTEDLRRLAAASRALLRADGLADSSRQRLQVHARQVRDKYRLRRFLDLKRRSPLAAAGFLLSSAQGARAVIRGVLADKVAAARRALAPMNARQNREPFRFLFPVRPVEANAEK